MPFINNQQAWDGLNQSLRNLVTTQMSQDQARRKHKIDMENLALNQIALEQSHKAKMMEADVAQKRWESNNALKLKEASNLADYRQGMLGEHRADRNQRAEQFAAGQGLRDAQANAANARGTLYGVQTDAAKLGMAQAKKMQENMDSLEKLEAEQESINSIPPNQLTPEIAQKRMQNQKEIERRIKRLSDYRSKGGITEKQRFEAEVELVKSGVAENREQARKILKVEEDEIAADERVFISKAAPQLANLMTQYKNAVGEDYKMPDQIKKATNDPVLSFTLVQQDIMSKMAASNGQSQNVAQNAPVNKAAPVQDAPMPAAVLNRPSSEQKGWEKTMDERINQAPPGLRDIIRGLQERNKPKFRQTNSGLGG